MIKKGTNVKWTWGESEAKGKVIEVHYREVEKTINSNKVTRKASQDSPAYLIEQDNGQKVLKSSSEVERCDN